MTAHAPPPPDPVVCLAIRASALPPAPPPPRALPPTRARALRGELLSGVACAVLGPFCVAIALLAHWRSSSWALVIAGPLFTLLGAWMIRTSVRQSRVLRLGTLVPARVLVMEPSLPVELRFVDLDDAAAVAAAAAPASRPPSDLTVAMARATFQHDGHERSAFTSLKKGELPLPVAFPSGPAPAVALLGPHAAVWVGPPSEASAIVVKP